MSNFKGFIRRHLARRGWLVQRTAGLSGGISLEHDLLQTARFPVPRVVLDVGAHHGETAERFFHCFPSTQIISLEPTALNFGILSKRARAWPNVTCHHLALSHRTGTSTIVLQRDSQTHSLETRRDDASLAGRTLETIAVTTLDDFAAAQHLATIDLLKLDVEGHELAVLKGAADLLSRHGIGAIFLEASLDPDDDGHTSLPDASAVLLAHGFKLTAIYDQAIGSDPTRLTYFNALFVSTHPSHRSRERVA